MEQDKVTKHYLSLLRYFLGSAFYMDQNVIVYSDDIIDFREMIPKKVTKKKSLVKVVKEEEGVEE